MTAADLLTFELANGAPANDTDPIGGAVDTEWSEGTSLLVATVRRDADGGSDQTYYGAAAKVIDDAATGDLANPAIVNRCAAVPNLAAGVAIVVSTSPLDAGTVRITGKVDGEWDQDDLVANGATPVGGALMWDADEFYAAEYLVASAPAKPVGNVSISIDGQVVAVIYGTGTPAGSDLGNGNTQANTLWALAVATAKNTAITWGTNNRRTAPTGAVGSFSRAQKWSGNDGSIALAADLEAEDYHQYCARLTVPAGIPIPVSGKFSIDVGLIGEI